MTMNLKKDFTLTFFDHRLFPMPAFGGLFSFKISPLGEISYELKKGTRFFFHVPSKRFYDMFFVSRNRLLCQGYGVVFCFAKSPLPASPSLTHQPVPALWQLSRLSLRGLNRLLLQGNKKTVTFMTDPRLTRYTLFSFCCVCSTVSLHFSYTVHAIHSE